MKCATRVGAPVIWSGRDQRTGGPDIVIPADCRVQFLELLAAGGNDQGGMELRIDSVSLARLGE
jgi:hypothetical protein